MFNTKNLITIFISAIIAALISWGISTQLPPFNGFTAFLFNAFLALLIMQIIQGIKTDSMTSTLSNLAPAKKGSPQVATSNSSDPDREKGHVKWFDSSKGYGFITREMGEDIFVHFRSIKGNGYRSLREGQPVEFIVTQGSKGPQAEDIHVVKL